MYGQGYPGQYPDPYAGQQQYPAQYGSAAYPGAPPSFGAPDVTYTNQYYDPNTQNQFYQNYAPGAQAPSQPAYYPQTPAAAPPQHQHNAAYQAHGQAVPQQALAPKKKALLVGINYIGTKSELKGCINDAINVQTLLLKGGYAQENIHILRDDSKENFWQPTRANIIREMDWLVWDAHSGDSLFFLFSGHGGQTEDLNGDEDDGMDETILPVDWRKAGEIIDDEVHDRLVKKVPAGARLNALMDCCHSGTGMDLPFVHTISGVPGAVHTEDYSHGRKSKKSSKRKQNKTSEQDKIQAQMSWGDVTLFSGCRDDQTSADARSLGKVPQGAMCYSWLKTLNGAQGYLTFHQVLASMRDILHRENKFEQVPQLSTGRPIDLNQPFVL